MSSILGPAPVVDFDGTVTLLPVDWEALRDAAGVPFIEDLWRTGGLDVWAAVTEAEMEAVEQAHPIEATFRALGDVEAFAILSANSEASIHTFLARYPDVAVKVRLVVGRETLNGSKRDPDRFAHGFQLCRAATERERDGTPVIYVGDRQYELELARAAGAHALHVSDL